MPTLIKSNKLSGLRPVFTDNLENYKRYIQIRKKFESTQLYRIFAEPKLDNFRQEAEWFTDWEGSLQTFSAFLQTHPGLSREELESSVKSEVNRLFAESAKYKDTDSEYRALNDTLQQCIEVPSNDDIYIMSLPSGEQKYILTNWGFIYDAFNAETGIIQKMKLLALFNLRVHFTYPNGAPAANEKIIVDANGQRMELVTDAQGEFVINRFPAQSSLALHQIDHTGAKVNAFQFPTVEEDVLNVSIKNIHVCDHYFSVTDEQGKALAAVPVVFRVNNVDSTLRSGNDGKIVLKDLPDQSAVECYYMVEQKPELLSAFRSNLTEVTHILKIPAAFLVAAPKEELPTEVVLHFVDKKKVDVTALPVLLSLPGLSPQQFTTGNDGRFIISPPVHGTRVKLSATKDKIKWNGSFKYDKSISYYLFVFKKKCRWWLWLLLGLLLALLLLLGMWFFKSCAHGGFTSNVENRVAQGVEVTVVDNSDNKEITGAAISLTAPAYSQQGLTGAEGKVSFSRVPAPKAHSPWVVYASKTGYGDERVEFNLAQNKITIRMKRIGNGGLVGKRGQFNVNLQWWTEDDLDLVITDPCGNMIYFKNKSQSCSNAKGELDVDANYSEDNLTKTPQENIVWGTASSGEYGIYVVFYEMRSMANASCKITIFNNNKKEELYKTVNYTGDRSMVLVKKVNL